MAKMKVTVLTGPQGGGKSTLMRTEAIAQPGLYLFVAPTHELIDEQVEAFRAEAHHLKIWPVHSKTKGKGKVEERLEHARAEIAKEGHKHAVILTTHDAMMDSDLSAFAGWHVVLVRQHRGPTPHGAPAQGRTHRCQRGGSEQAPDEAALRHHFQR